MAKSPAAQAKQIQLDVSNLLRKFDLTLQNTAVRDNLLDLKQDLGAAWIYARDYEYSETKAEQTDNGRRATRWLVKANAKILKASENNIFGPVDVAHLSAQIEQLKSELN